jgi:AcrR family transcriptional regulator
VQNVLMRGEQATVGAQPSDSRPDPRQPGGSPARVRNRWGQGERLRAEILMAAGQLLGELGTADGLTLRGVARQAGIAPASIYTQFADRAALIDALVAHEHEHVADLMRQAGQAEQASQAEQAGPGGQADPAEQASPAGQTGLAGQRADGPAGQGGHAAIIRAQLYALCRYSLAHPGHYRLMFGGGGNISARYLLDELTGTLTAGESAGARLRLPADRGAIVLLVGTHGRVAIWHAQGETGTEDRVLRFVDDLVGLVFDDQ